MPTAGLSSSQPPIHSAIRRLGSTVAESAIRWNSPDSSASRSILPSDNHLIVYYQNYYGLFAPFELMGFVVTLHEEARKKIAAKCRRIGRELKGAMQNPRAP